MLGMIIQNLFLVGQILFLYWSKIGFDVVEPV